MASIVHRGRRELERHGEYVALANISSGWFAVFPATWEKRAESAARAGRPGPNLIVCRTKTGDPRDHCVVPHSVVRPLLTGDTLTHSQANGVSRWNLTLRDGLLHVTHRPGKVDVRQYQGAPLILEAAHAEPKGTVPSLADAAAEFTGIIESIARETKVIAKSRSRRLRDAVVHRSQGVCEACGTDFSAVLNGRGRRALQVHHKDQLSLQEAPKTTEVGDLAVVCADCHAIIHADPQMATPVDVLRRQWNRERQSARRGLTE